MEVKVERNYTKQIKEVPSSCNFCQGNIHFLGVLVRNALHGHKYGQVELDYLKKKDKKLGAAIERIGKIEREVIPDLFTALINCIVGQQISAKAAITV